jgi:diguanylate cyclase (GGDEF)-like protein
MLLRLFQRLQYCLPSTGRRAHAWPRLLVVGFIAQLILIFFVTQLGLNELDAGNERLRAFKDDHALRLELSQTMQTSARERTLSLTRMINMQDLFELDAEQLRFHTHGQAFMLARRRLESMDLTPREKALLAEQWERIRAAQPYQEQVISLSLALHRKEASEVLIRYAVPAQDSVMQSLTRLDEVTREGANQAMAQAGQAHQLARQWMIALSSLALGLGIMIAVVVVRLMHGIGQERERLATHDSLTGLPNRTLLMDRLEQAILRARRQQDRVGILFLDLDGFKAINDTQGHAVGDEVLRHLAQRLQQVVRANDIVARLGGDEFVICLVDAAQREQIEHVCEKLLAAVARPLRVGGQHVSLSGSLGVCVFPDDGQDAKGLLRCADLAMYAAKRSGKNQTYHFSPALCQDALPRS